MTDWKEQKSIPVITALQNASDALKKALPLVAKANFDAVKNMIKAAVEVENLDETQKRAFVEKMKEFETRMNELCGGDVE